jgi:uncharacterized protein (TIGR03086 family)
VSDVSDRYRKLASEMAERIAAVPDDGWAAPTPCEGWTARDLVRHVVETPAIFFGMVDEPAPSGGPSVDDDPVGAFGHVRDAVQAALDDPAVADRTYDGAFGRNTFAGGVGQFICADLVVHSWDLARATGQDERLDPDEVRALYEGMLPMDEAMRGPGAFGPKVDPPPDADEQTRLLCFLGRRV